VTTDPIELVSQREAAQILSPLGVSRDKSRQLLAHGLAGPPVRTRRAVLYDLVAVDRLAERVEANDATLDDAAPHGLVLLRRALTPGPAHVLRDQLAHGWDLTVLATIWLRLRIEQSQQAGLRGLPAMATVAGFPVVGAEVTGLTTVFETATGSSQRLDLTPPGPWWIRLSQLRVPTGAGRPWVLRDPSHLRARGRVRDNG